MAHLGDEDDCDEQFNIAWKATDISPIIRARRFINDMKRKKEAGNRLSLAFLERWTVHLIYAVMASQVAKIQSSHVETTCVVCGSKIYCCGSEKKVTKT